GTGKLQVPRFGELEVNHTLYDTSKFTDGLNGGGHPDRLTICEVYMLRLMERLTDKPNWEQDIFDDRLVAQWYTELSDSNLHSESEPNCDVDMDLVYPRTWEWCISELRDKAIEFHKTGYVLTFNADSGVCKPDTLVGMKNEEQEAFEPLRNQAAFTSKDPNPVKDLVDPSLFMLIYGRTGVLTEGGQVTMANGDLLYPTNVPIAPARTRPFTVVRTETWSTRDAQSLHKWTHDFQWLPCEVEFTGQDSGVRITSYINNLHPKHQRAYAAIEKLISFSLDPWSEVLAEWTSCYPPRIKTRGVEKDYDYLNDETYVPIPTTNRSMMPTERWRKYCSDAYYTQVRDFLDQPEPDLKYRFLHPHRSDAEGMPVDSTLAEYLSQLSHDELARLINEKYQRLRAFRYPEPGISYSYKEWKQGKTSQPIVEKTRILYPEPDHTYQTHSLQDKFRDKGLQVIIRISSIELTPDNPSYAGDDDFSIAGLMNEHIVSISRYYYDVENLTPARISFQQGDGTDERYMQGEPNALEKIYGLSPTPRPRPDPRTAEHKGLHRRLQTLGSVSTREGRFLAWSNTLRSKTQPFSLKDKSRPGHQRFIDILLVDPHYRICSTRNVPPQQNHWWREVVQASTPHLPPELMILIMEETEYWPMGIEEAQERKKKAEVELEQARKTQ
ncbi:DUF4246 domain-containing protein, partial [Aspergillus ibericus CBS 121593]